jgi:AraC-like DNA-binding protein
MRAMAEFPFGADVARHGAKGQAESCVRLSAEQPDGVRHLAVDLDPAHVGLGHEREVHVLLLPDGGGVEAHRKAGAVLVGLAVSNRTLIRRLREAGTTYRELRDAHRRRLAIELVAGSSLTAAEIAYRLGYEDASNFGKACHRWFGRSPGALRKQRRERPRHRARRGHTSIGG